MVTSLSSSFAVDVGMDDHVVRRAIDKTHEESPRGGVGDRQIEAFGIGTRVGLFGAQLLVHPRHQRGFDIGRGILRLIGGRALVERLADPVEGGAAFRLALHRAGATGQQQGGGESSGHRPGSRTGRGHGRLFSGIIASRLPQGRRRVHRHWQYSRCGLGGH